MIELFPLVAAVGSGFCFAGMQVIFRLEAGRMGVLGLPMLLAMLLPIWVALLGGLVQVGAVIVNWDWAALRWPLGWAVCTVTTTTGLVWLLGRFSLSEVTGYKKALLTLGAAGVDVVVFGTPIGPTVWLAMALLLGAALGLSHARSRMPTLREWGVIGCWCVVLVVQISLYKQGQKLQPSVLAHTLVAQCLAAGLYALLWLLPSVRRQVPPAGWVVAVLLGLALVGTLLEGFGYAGLPLSVVLLATLLPAALMSAYDLHSGGLPWTWRVGVSLAALLGGFGLLLWR